MKKHNLTRNTSGGKKWYLLAGCYKNVCPCCRNRILEPAGQTNDYLSSWYSDLELSGGTNKSGGLKMNETDVIYLSNDYQMYISMAVHDHILNSLGTVFVMAFLLGFCFGFVFNFAGDEFKIYLHKLKIRGEN